MEDLSLSKENAAGELVMTNIEAIAELKNWVKDLENRLGEIDTTPFDMAIEALEAYPPKTHIRGIDTISRKKAVGLITAYPGAVDKSVAKRILIQMEAVDLDKLFMDHYKQGRLDEKAEKEGQLMQSFNGEEQDDSSQE